jgi:hypothetical protein
VHGRTSGEDWDCTRPDVYGKIAPHTENRALREAASVKFAFIFSLTLKTNTNLLKFSAMFKKIRPGTHIAQLLTELLEKHCTNSISEMPESPFLLNETDEIHPNLALYSKTDRTLLFMADVDIQSCGRNEDHSRKLRLMETAGIAEHWLIFPADKIIVKRKADTFRRPQIFETGEDIELPCCGTIVRVSDIIQ